MVNLSADFFSKVETFLNPLNDRELNLRGYKIPMLEHLGACCRQMDTLNLMDNELKVLAGPFPSLPRLRHVYLTNNRLHSLEPGLERYFPFLETLLFTNNAFTELKYVRYLHGLKHLTHVSFLGNPITKHKWYRSYVIYHVPQIRVLDYQRVKERERLAAKNYFSNIPPALLHPEPSSSMSSTSFKATTSTTTHESRSMSMDTMELDEADLPPHQDFTEPIQGSLSPSPPSSSSSTLTALEIQQLKHAIQNAQSLAEIQRLEEALHSGILPSSLASFPHSSSPTSHDMEEEEEEEEEKEPLQDPIQAHPMDPSET